MVYILAGGLCARKKSPVYFSYEWQKQEDSTAELCRRYGISRRVGYKWPIRLNGLKSGS